MILSDEHKAMSLIRSYVRNTNNDERQPVCLSMPLKLPVKRYDGTYRTKLVPSDVKMIVHNAYFSKKEDLICQLTIENIQDAGAEVEDIKYVEIPMKVLGDRIESADFKKLMADIGNVTDGEVTFSDAFATPAEADNYDTIEEFGSWS